MKIKPHGLKGRRTNNPAGRKPSGVETAYFVAKIPIALICDLRAIDAKPSIAIKKALAAYKALHKNVDGF